MLIIMWVYIQYIEVLTTNYQTCHFFRSTPCILSKYIYIFPRFSEIKTPFCKVDCLDSHSFLHDLSD